MKFSVGCWIYGKTGDRFLLSGYKDDLSIEEKIELISQNKDISGVEFTYPDDFSKKSKEEIKKLVKDANLKVSVIGVNLFGDRIYQFGSLTSNDEKIRKRAIELCKNGIDIACFLSCDKFNMWLGQDGFDYPFQSDYKIAYKNLIRALEEISDYKKNIKICLEYKLKEPRTHLYINSAAKALLIVKEINRENVGVTIDVGHAFNAGENLGEVISFLDKKLFHLHLNDNYNFWDDDMIVGSVHFMEYLEMFYWLKEINYKGYISLDLFPYRENALEAVRESIEYLKGMQKIVEKVGYHKIKKMLKSNEITKILKIFREEIFK
jgi:xylose isomerase